MEVGKLEKDKDSDHSTTISHHTPVHIRQRYRWDCGVTCVMMVLPPEQRQDLMTRFHEVCQEEGFGNSTWTIDLCYLLKRYNVKHHMYTTTMGVNEAHKNNRYYEKIFDLDQHRIRQRFSQAAPRGIHITVCRWNAQLLARHVATGQPAIVLVDRTMLACDLCKHNKLNLQLRSWFGGSYSGHYVVVVSWAGSHIRFLDPGADPGAAHGACAARAGSFLAASDQPGTDCDLILVYNNHTDDDTSDDDKG